MDRDAVSPGHLAPPCFRVEDLSRSRRRSSTHRGARLLAACEEWKHNMMEPLSRTSPIKKDVGRLFLFPLYRALSIHSLPLVCVVSSALLAFKVETSIPPFIIIEQLQL